MTINVAQAQKLLGTFDFQKLFIETLGWNYPRGVADISWQAGAANATCVPIATLAGVVVFEVTTADGEIPDREAMKAIDSVIAKQRHEHLLIFLDGQRTRSLWYWVKRDGAKTFPRSHAYLKSQTGESFIAKLSPMMVEFGDLDPETGELRLVDAINRLQRALDVEPVKKSFYEDFRKLHDMLMEAIVGVPEVRDRRWYASALLNRLMFVYFLQRRSFLDRKPGQTSGDYGYLRTHFTRSKAEGANRYFEHFLLPLFFEGFAKPEQERDPDIAARIGHVRYLNGGMFLPHAVEQRYEASLQIPDAAFDQILTLFDSYNWALDDSPTGNEKEINPAVLGFILEKYINQKEFGAYYTRTEITDYLCEQTISRLVLERVNERLPEGAKSYETLDDLLLKGTAQTCRWLLLDILPGLRLIDPSCGSGAFLAAAMRKLISIYTGLIGPVKMRFAGDTTLRDWLRGIEANHPSIEYYIKKQIIVNNLYGVDLMDEAVDIARLRLFLALVASANSVDDLEPLPNIDFNVLQGNALVGLLRVDEAKAEKGIAAQVAQSSLWSGQSQQSYRAIVEEKNRLVRAYRNTAQTLRAEDLHVLRDDIQAHRARAYDLLDALLLDDFQALGVKYEQATWDEAKRAEGKPQRRSLTLADIRALRPFHWGYEFDEVMNERGGFDAIITNPPWEALKPQDKEFFTEYSNAITKNKMRIEDLDREKAALLRDPTTRVAYLAYLSNFPFQSEYFRSAAQFANQQSVVNGRRTGTDVNLYKLFTEQCFNLLRTDGHCGIVLPSGIYTDLGAKQLRVLLFEQTSIEGLICFENRKNIFDGVHNSFKIVILTFRKGGATERFPAAFMRQDVTQLVDFPRADDLRLTVKLIEDFAPDSLSLVEFKSEIDITIAERMLQFPMLGAQLPDTWNVSLGREFDMTNDHALFLNRATPGSLPLYEGKMIHQFTHSFAEPRYWVDEAAGRRALLPRGQADTGQRLDYQRYRFAFRDIARSTDTRTFIATILSPNVFCGNTVFLENEATLPQGQRLYLVALFNSFVLDYLIRLRVTTHVSFFFVNQLRVPRLTASDPRFKPIVERAARLICVTPEYDVLAATVGLGDRHSGVTDPAARNAIRAELDALVARLYGLSEEELAHLLTTFPNVEQAQKDAVMAEYRALTPSVSDLAVAQFIAQGESEAVEFKVAAAWNAMLGQEDRNGMPAKVVQAVASFLNSRKGGNVIIGVDDKGQVVGIADDIAHADPKRQDRDGYERYLRSKINDLLGASNTLHYAVSFHTVTGCEVCLIAVDPVPGPVYDQYGDLYVRDGNGKKKLSAQQAQEYIKHHWPR